MEDRNKSIHLEYLCQRKPFDPHSFNDFSVDAIVLIYVRDYADPNN